MHNNPTSLFTSLADINDVNYYGAGNQAALREVMQAWDKAVDFDFTEITETVGGTMLGKSALPLQMGAPLEGREVALHLLIIRVLLTSTVMFGLKLTTLMLAAIAILTQQEQVMMVSVISQLCMKLVTL